MERTCSQCGKSFAHQSSLSRHRKVCGTRASRLPCPHCATTFARASDLKRHVNKTCKGTKRPAETILPENPKRALVDYESSDEEESREPATEQPVHPFQSWRATGADTESEEKQTAQPSDEEPLPGPSRSWRVPSDTESQAHPIGSWRAPDRSSDEEETSEDDEESSNWDSNEEFDEEGAESSDSEEEFNEEESSDEWHTADEEPWEDEVPPHSEETSSLNLDTLRQALPWAQYEGMPEEQFGGAAQRIEGNPLFEFDFNPISEQQWLRRLQKTVYHAQLRQRRDPEDTDDMGMAIVSALEEATRQHLTKMGAKDEDRVFLALTPNGFEHVYQTTEFKVGEFKTGSTRLDALMRKIAGKLNSNESFQLDITLLRPIGTGSGHGKQLNPGRMGVAMSRHVKTSIVEIRNSDDLCCARAIITMKALAEWKAAKKREERNEVPTLLQKLRTEEKEARKDYETLRDTRKTSKKTLQLQTALAQQLHFVAGVPKGPCGRDELETFQTYLSAQDPPFQLKVFCDQVKKPLYTGPLKVDEDHILCLLKSRNHFDGIVSLPGFLNTSYFCHECNRAFNTDDPDNHPCQGQKCRACGGHLCPDRFKKTTLPCADCHGLFRGPSCLDHHKLSGYCAKFLTCPTCCARFNREKEHACFEAKCPSCGEMENLTEHQCYIQPEDEEDGLEPTLFVYADIEAMTMPNRQFQPNLLCYETSEGEKEALWGEDCCWQFIEKLETMAWIPVGKKKKKERPVIVLFHNLKGFDGVFILKTLYKHGWCVTNQFSMGAKVLSFKTGPITFKDSLCFLPFPLSAFPNTFGIEEIKKGYFPHMFNTPDHQNYVGSIPPKHYFDPDGMKPKDKAAFERWYKAQTGRFDFRKELLEYCQSDVELQKEGCNAFVEKFSQEARFNPFEKCMTIAAACNLYWRRSILEDTPAAKIAVRPLRGWRGAQINQSNAALQWLAYEESLLPLGGDGDQIKHARNGGEKKVWTSKGQEFVDGWNKNGKIAFEFLGCLWHGCPSCYPKRRNAQHAVMPDRTFNEVHRATLEKLKRLKEAKEVKAVKSIWECQWKKLVEENEEVKRAVNELERVDPLVPREAFFGGRSGAVSLFHRVGSGEQIHYMDVTSLYPWVNKTCPYPLGHPVVYTRVPVQDFSQYFGLAKVDILPPPDLFHPVLPLRCNGKLTFPLCAACVKAQQQLPMLERSPLCDHPREQRMLRGTWCTPEIKEAMRMGYELVKVHEVWHFEDSASGLFAEYVNTWLKIKTEASGWPVNCTTEEEKRSFIERFEAKEGIRLEYGNVKPNPGLKATAKLMLNSFWGKFGQRENLPQTEQCTTPQELYNITEDDTKQVQDIRFCSEDIVEVVFKNKEEAVVPSNKTNVFVAAFTTCHARLKLYSYLERLGQQVLYYDTDSVIYRWKEGLPRITTGDFLGDMKNEVEGDHIVEFVSGGAKNYGYQTAGGKVECKVRGFTLNVRGKTVLNYDTMKKLVLKELKEGEKTDLQVCNPSHFKRNTKRKDIQLVEQTKKYRLVFDKRVIDPQSMMSYPFGYCQLFQ